MPSDLAMVVAISGVAAIASIAGGILALLHRPSTLVMSAAFGFAGGALVATATLEMVPQALELAPLGLVVAGLAVGFGAVYAFDLWVHRGLIAGEHADQARRVKRRYRRAPPHGGSALVVSAATSVEELIEGLAIGVGAVVAPALAGLVALAITLDNLAEGLSLGELIRGESHTEAQARRRTLLWTGTVAGALFISSIVGWALLGDLPEPVLGTLVAGGAGAMLYLTLGNLLPEGQARQFEQSTAVAAGLAFLVMLVLGALR